MRKGGGHNKGSAQERLIAKRLSLWVTSGKREDVFWRSSISGGRATFAQKKGKLVRQSGDICSVAPEGHVLTDKFYFESKHYRKLFILEFLIKDTGLLSKFWKHARKQATHYRKEPVLIVKQNNLPILVIARRSAFHAFTEQTPFLVASQYSVWLFDDLMKSEFTG
jgi:hypothetical protein